MKIRKTHRPNSSITAFRKPSRSNHNPSFFSLTYKFYNMAFNAKLNMAGKQYDVLSCSYTLNRDVDHKGRPSSGVYGGTIDVEVESTEDTSIIEAMVNSQFKPFAGTVLIKKTDEDSKMKEVAFEGAFIVKYTEGLNVIGSDPMKLRFTISARKMKLGNAEHVNDWPDAKA